ncbi:MAG: 2-oxoacid:acceptor oxidoreductase subunit alpha [Chloroflexia bacterium]|nr:2-oxoacid:acceptor oxidoreductase subunit alpha [Chloroflexia bacterium]
MARNDIHFMMGNQACAEGALAAGCRFFAGYPITPSSEIAEILSRRLPRVGGKFIQMEDEIASIAAIIGASLGGLKSLTATSGPGFSLMQENLGFAVMAEIPCVIVNVQRGGPSTGLPTKPSQGDVMQARWGTHGDHPIIALAPSTVHECFTLTVRAFNLAERYRTPVILLMDADIAHMRERVQLPQQETLKVINRLLPGIPPEWYAPYSESEGPVPPLAPFGLGYRYHVTGLFHDAMGFPTSRTDEVNQSIDRLFGKIEHHLAEILQWEELAMDGADCLVIAYGSVARAAERAVKEARNRGISAGLLKLLTLWPFPHEHIKRLSEHCRRIVVPELNRGQLVLEVERAVARNCQVRRINRLDGSMITPKDILDCLREE